MPQDRALVIDNDRTYRRLVKKSLTAKGFSVEETHSVEKALSYAPGFILILLDNKHGKESYWRDLLFQLRRKNPQATILLISGYSDQQLREDVNRSDEATKYLIGTDPLVAYLPKKGGPDYKDHLERLTALTHKLTRGQKSRALLQSGLIATAFAAARTLSGMSLESLRKRVPEAGKEDTMRMDIVAEECIKDSFGTEMHFRDVVICTEEAGLHNELFHRVSSPEFFVFSDPFDGSSAFKEFSAALAGKDSKDHPLEDSKDSPFRKFAERLKGKASEETLLREVAANPDLVHVWEEVYGPSSVNSPMVSMVLAERHRVVGAVLVNLFTAEVCVSLDRGNYSKNCPAFEGSDVETLSKAITEGMTPQGWKPLEFRNYGQLRNKEKRLFLCTLKKGSPFGEHAEACLGPILRGSRHDWEASLRCRAEQNNFTPGPGRVLFLMNTESTEKYEKEALGSSSYNCILSAGEPLTEWIGWFAFLRHAQGISAFCLRRREQIFGHCQHRRHLDDPSTLLPDAVASIFREGYVDVAVLHTAYGSNMRRYIDTVLVAFDDDVEWKKILKSGEDIDLFTRIPLFQSSKE